MPSGRFDPTTIESLLLDAAARILRNSLAKPLIIQLDDYFYQELSEAMHRSSLLLSMAEKGNDDASQTTKVPFQTLLDWKNTVDAVRQPEKKLKDLVPTLSGSNDELFERITSREEWYLRCGTDSFHRSELESALRRSPITDSAALGAHLRRQLTDIVLSSNYEFNDTAVYKFYRNLAVLVLSIDDTIRRGEVDIFHSLVLMLGMFQPLPCAGSGRTFIAGRELQIRGIWMIVQLISFQMSYERPWRARSRIDKARASPVNTWLPFGTSSMRGDP